MFYQTSLEVFMRVHRFLFLATLSFSLSFTGFAKVSESTENLIPAKNTSIISESEFFKLQQHFDPKKSLDSSEIQSLPSSALNYYPIWYCVAQSYFSGAWYYWYSPDYNYARFRALNACTYYNGYTCFVNCEIRY